MEKSNLTRAARDFISSTLPGFPFGSESSTRSLRGSAPIERDRARAACAPMGALVTVLVTEDAHKRRRTWYVIDPDPAVGAQYAALGLDLIPGCKVLVDAELMRPTAILDFDPAVSSREAPSAAGFNPYFDLPPS